MSEHEAMVQRKTHQLLTEIEPHLHGYPREIILRASIRLIAAMLGPAKPETQRNTIEAIPVTLHLLLKEMKQRMEVMRERDKP